MKGWDLMSGSNLRARSKIARSQHFIETIMREKRKINSFPIKPSQIIDLALQHLKVQFVGTCKEHLSYMAK